MQPTPVGAMMRMRQYVQWIKYYVIGFVMLRLFARRTVQGINVFIDPNVSDASEDLDDIWQRLDSAFSLLAAHDSTRWARIRRDVRRVAVFRPPKGGVGEYSPIISTVIVDPQYVASRPPESLALLMVHEATHARLRYAGHYYLPSIQRRHERICVKQEMAFAQRLPATEDRESRLRWLDEKMSLWRENNE